MTNISLFSLQGGAPLVSLSSFYIFQGMIGTSDVAVCIFVLGMEMLGHSKIGERWKMAGISQAG